MHLIRRAVTQTLIVARTNEDRRLHHAPRVSIVHNFISIGFHSILVSHQARQVINCRLTERRAISKATRHTPNLAHQRLHELGNRHTRRNTVRIDDDVRDDT